MLRRDDISGLLIERHETDTELLLEVISDAMDRSLAVSDGEFPAADVIRGRWPYGIRSAIRDYAEPCNLVGCRIRVVWKSTAQIP